MLHIKHNPFHYLFHSLAQTACMDQNLHRFLCRVRRQNPPDGFRIRPTPQRLRRQQFRTAVRLMRVGIHNPSGHFDEFPDMSDKQNSLKPHLHRHLKNRAHIIAAFHRLLRVNLWISGKKILPVISGYHQQIPASGRPPHFHLHTDRRDQRFLAHGHYNPAGTENRNSSDNAQPGIKRPLCCLLSFRNRNHNSDSPRISFLLHDFQHLLPDHRPGHPVDGGSARRLIQPRACNTANPFAAINHNFRFCQPADRRQNPQPVGGIRIIASILLYTKSHFTFCLLKKTDRKAKLNSFRRHQLRTVRSVSGQKTYGRRLRRRCGAGACCVSKTKLFPVFHKIGIFQTCLHDLLLLILSLFALSDNLPPCSVCRQ